MSVILVILFFAFAAALIPLFFRLLISLILTIILAAIIISLLPFIWNIIFAPPINL
jgi:hypothetical protein